MDILDTALEDITNRLNATEFNDEIDETEDEDPSYEKLQALVDQVKDITLKTKMSIRG